MPPSMASRTMRIASMNDIRQGIVHIIGPEQGWTLPGLIIVCGDSHTATHGAFGSLAIGIGTVASSAAASNSRLSLSPSGNLKPAGSNLSDAIHTPVSSVDRRRE